MNDFTKEELEYFLMVMKPFHFLWKHDPLELENKLQSMIDNYCEHEGSGIEYLSYPPQQKCKKCGEYFR